MKIRFKDKELAKRTNLLQDEYRVVVKEGHPKIGYTYTFFNENLQEMKVGDNNVEIIDHDMSDMVQRNDLGYGHEFYINELFIKLIPLELGNFITTSNIWQASKAFRYFEKYNYQIPDSYRDRVFNENYKMNLIEGYLLAVNHYIIEKFREDKYREYEGLEFYKWKSIDEIILKEGEHLEELDVDGYKSLLLNFIEKALFDKEPGEERSKFLCKSFFQLIDALFVYDISKIYSYRTIYDNYFVIEYQNEYYYLNSFWNS